MDCGSSVTADAQARVHCGLATGDAQNGARAGVFAAGSAHGGPVTTGVYAGVNANGHGLSVQHSHTPNVGNTTSTMAHANLFENKHQSLNANAFHNNVQPNLGSSFNQVGGGLNLQTAGGHAAGLGVTHVPQFNMTTMNANAQANLWKSANGTGSLDATANAMRHMSGPFKGQQNIGGGIIFKKTF